MSIDNEKDDDDDIYSLFDKVDPVYDMSTLNDNEEFKKILLSTDMPNRYGTPNLKKPTAAMRLGTSTGFHRQGTARLPGTGVKPMTGYRPTTGFRPITSDVNRPMTAVRGAGYTSHGKPFDPLNQAAQISSSTLELQKEESVEDKIRTAEGRIVRLVEEACILNSRDNIRQALDKAKEASSKERSLIRMQEQAGLGDHHNMDLTYSVLFTLANQYASNELYNEALNTYQLITKNRMFGNPHRLKVNMGNIFFKQGQFLKAVKMYRMALDQVPSSQKNLRIKIMHNIGMVFVKMGQWEEAVSSLEYTMSEQASHRAGLHLVLCCLALEDKDRIKHAFTLLLSVPLELEDDEKYNIEQDNAEEALIATAIKNDGLHRYEMKCKADADYCILTAAKLIAPVIEDNFGMGYDWCVEIIKNSDYARLAGDLEINKAVMFLKERQLSDAINTLKTFEKDPTHCSNAATNLSFIYYLQGDLENAEKYGEIAKESDSYNTGGFINLGACAMARGNISLAKTYFLQALECDPASVEAQYNLGLVLKNQGAYEEALECFQKFSGSLSLMPAISYHIATLLERMGDIEAAIEGYQQLLGLVPTDAVILQKLGELYDHEGDKQQAHHYHYDSFRYYPSNISVIEWLGAYYIEMQVVEKAQIYFEKASIMQPNEPKWRMMIAGCHRRSGNLHRALNLYQDIHQRFPENAECLRFLVRLCSDLGLREAQEYTLELKKLEKAKEVRDRVGSSRPGSRRSNSGLSSRAGSGFSPVPERASHVSPVNAVGRNSGIKLSRLSRLHDSAGSGDSGFAQGTVDASYSDPLGPSAARPRTAAGKPLDFDDFGDEQLGDDLLPV